MLAKTRLALANNKRSIPIPRLELQAALTAAKLTVSRYEVVQQQY